MIRAPALALACALLALATGCRSGDDAPSQATPGRTPSSAESARPLDRLEPGELAAGNAAVFGFVLPRQMTVDRRFHNEAHASGAVSATGLAEYVRKRVTAAHVEMTGQRITFENTRIRDGDPKRFYRFEILPDGTRTRLVVRDVTPPPTEPGLSEAERWKRAGMTPDGKLVDPKSLE